MSRIITAFILIGLMAAPVAAQGNGKGKNKSKVPPGHLPSAGLCRVWYEGVPPGHQPPPTSCVEAERVAARSRNARVIYSNDRGNRRDDIWRDDDRRPGSDRDSRDRNGRTREGRAIPRGDQYPGTYPYPDDRYPSRRGGYTSVAVEKGYEDGVTKGREDARDGDRFDPARHSWYRSANRGYNTRYGSREQYAEAYRSGFLDGYREAHRGTARGTTNGRPRWWPF